MLLKVAITRQTATVAYLVSRNSSFPWLLRRNTAAKKHTSKQPDPSDLGCESTWRYWWQLLNSNQ